MKEPDMNRPLNHLVSREPVDVRIASPVDASVAPTSAPRELAPAMHAPRKLQSIVVPVDGTPFGEHAIPVALGIAERAGAELILVHIHSPLQFESRANRIFPDGVLDEWLLRERRDCLNTLVRRVAHETTVRVQSVLVDGPEIAERLCSTAVLTSADLMVMATHGRGPLGRFWFGSVADTLIQRSPTPVLFVRGSGAPAPLAAAPAFRNVLIPLDGSNRAEDVVPAALALGQMSEAVYTLMRVVPIVVDCSLGVAPLMRPLPHSKRDEEAAKYVGKLTSRLNMDPARVRTCTVFDDRSTADAILQFAGHRRTDLIALATRGRGRLSRFIHGSVVDQVVRNAAVPVLIQRSPGV
jgi:nucleotide-binding universal stress UspA family protein